MQIDAIEQRAGQPTLIFGSTSDIRAAFAGEAGVTGAPATAGIHCRHQHETCRIGNPMVGFRDRDFTGFKRLA